MKRILPLLTVASAPLWITCCSTAPTLPGGLHTNAASGSEEGAAAVAGPGNSGGPEVTAEPPPYAPLVHTLGEGTTPDGDSDCTLSASAASKSPLKRQQLQFAYRRTGPGGWVVQRLLVQSGASKSQADLQSLLAAALRKSGAAARGDELAKIGDVRFGGELRLLADGAGGTTFAYSPGLPDGNPTLSAQETILFAELLSR